MKTTLYKQAIVSWVFENVVILIETMVIGDLTTLVK